MKLKLTQSHLNIINQYVDEELIDVDRLIAYLEKHKIIKNDVFRYCSRRDRNHHNLDFGYCMFCSSNEGYNPVERETFIRRIPFYFYNFKVKDRIISYITDNIRILRLILQMVNAYTESWDEFEFGDNMPQYLLERKDHIVDLPAADARQKEQEVEIQTEKETTDVIQTVEIYDYSEDDIEQSFNQIIRAIHLLTVVARCLPNFEHSMPKADKDAFVDLIYRLPNKIFNLWATEANKVVNEMVSYFKEQSHDYYIRQKKLSEDDIVKALQWVSMSFLLELYNLPVFYATKDNTLPYLSGYNYSQKDTYSLEHLMMLERQAAPKVFIDRVFALSKETKCHLYPVLIKRVVNHALVMRSDFEHNQVQQLQTKFFPSRDAQKQIMVGRMKNSKKENE